MTPLVDTYYIYLYHSERDVEARCPHLCIGDQSLGSSSSHIQHLVPLLVGGGVSDGIDVMGDRWSDDDGWLVKKAGLW